jgi:hypothetical protein
MEKVHKFRYFVVPKESITIKVTCLNFGASMPSVEMVLDDDSVNMPNTGTNSAPVFKFKVTMPVDEAHQVHPEFSFQHDAPDNAQYKVDISGKNDVGCPCGFKIKSTTKIQDPDITFDVRYDS